MRYKPVENDLFVRNRNKLFSKIGANALAIFYPNEEVLRNGDQFYPYRQNSDLFYFTGIEQEKTVLLLCPGASEASNREILFLREPNPRLETWQGRKLTLSEAAEISGISNVRYLAELDNEIYRLAQKHPTIYHNSSDLLPDPSSQGTHSSRLRQALEAKYPKHKIESISPFVQDLRLIKEPEELACMKKACDITQLAFERLCRTIKPGMKEYEAEAEIAYEFTRNGARHAYDPIIASGINACTLHYTRNSEECADGDLVLIDFGAEYANYAADCTRTLPVSGKFTNRQRRLYDATLRVFKKTIPLMIPGNTIAGLNEQAGRIWELEHIALGLYNPGNLKEQDPASPLFMGYVLHGISHFIGLDVHDVGNKHTILKPGMVLTCEPGFYLPNEHTGIRIETNILISENGPIDLMAHIPVEPGEIEARMKSGSPCN
jgi:Xaa-Pro aminopeptidase